MKPSMLKYVSERLTPEAGAGWGLLPEAPPAAAVSDSMLSSRQRTCRDPELGWTPLFGLSILQFRAQILQKGEEQLLVLQHLLMAGEWGRVFGVFAFFYHYIMLLQHRRNLWGCHWLWFHRSLHKQTAEQPPSSRATAAQTRALAPAKA